VAQRRHGRVIGSGPAAPSADHIADVARVTERLRRPRHGAARRNLNDAQINRTSLQSVLGSSGLTGFELPR